MRIVNYRCEDCYHEGEEWFNDTEERPDKLAENCPKCGGLMRKWDFKNNEHRVAIFDRGGI